MHISTEPDQDKENRNKESSTSDERSSSIAWSDADYRAYLEGFSESDELLLKRASAVLFRAMSELTKEELKRLHSVDDTRMLVVLAKQSLSQGSHDRMARLKLKGAERFEELLSNSGGAITGEELAKLEQITLDALRKRIERHWYLALKAGQNWRLPVIQFKPDSLQVWPEIQALLKAEPDAAPESIFRFLATRVHPPEDTETPVDKIRGGAMPAEKLIREFNQRYEARG